MLLIKNGRVLDPASKTDAALDVLLDGEKIKEVGPAGKVAAPQGTEVLDAKGLIVAPGFIDLHAHLREPGQESSETIETGTRAAAFGGTTTIIDFAVQNKGESMIQGVDNWHKKAEGKCAIDYGFHLITTELEDKQIEEMYTVKQSSTA